MLNPKTEYINVNGKPTFNAQQVGDVAVDLKNQKVYEYYRNAPQYSTSQRWREATDATAVEYYLNRGGAGIPGTPGQDGQDGKDATVSVGVVSTTTVDWSQPASVIVTDGDPSPSGATLNFAFQIPKGKDGTNGTGTGASIPNTTVYNPYLIEFPAEIQVLGTNSTQTIGQAGYSYSGITTTSSDLVDWANLQYALYLANQKQKKIVSAGRFQTNKMVDLGKLSFRIDWDGGNNTYIKTINNNAFSVIGRPKPTDNNDANVMIQATYLIRGIRIEAQSNQIGLEPGPSYHSTFSELAVTNAKTAIHLRFSLNTTLFKCDAGGSCMNGFIADIGNWTGANASNSQSNQTVFDQCHAYYGTPNQKGDVAFGIYGSSGCEVKHCIVEGAGYKKGIDFDFLLSPNVKDFTVDNLHYEGIYGNAGAGTGESIIRLRLVGCAFIKNIYSQYGGCFIDAQGTPGQLYVYVEGVTWLVADSNGKLFNNLGGVSWLFSKNSYQTQLVNPNTLPQYFAGTAVTRNTNLPYQCGSNQFNIQ